MSQALSAPVLDFVAELTSGSTFPATFGSNGNAGVASATNANKRYPTWFQCVGAGTNVLVCEDGSTLSIVCSDGEIIPGTFKSVTSMGSTRMRLGTGAPPPPSPAASVADLYTDARSTLGKISLPPSSFYLLTGAPLAVFANGTTTVPGMAFEGSKALGIRWNNDAAPAAVTTSFDIPPDMDITADATLHARIAKTGATNNAGNTTTLAIGLFNQVDGALYDADTDFGGATSALLPAATAKTVQNVTRTIAAADLAAHPASTTVTVKPTAGTLDTDDLVLSDVYILYKKKLLPAS